MVSFKEIFPRLDLWSYIANEQYKENIVLGSAT